MISIVVMEIENPGNLGAIARVMKNFNQKDLILINPKCKKTEQEARNRAKHANDILKSAKVKPLSHLKTYDYLIATTGSLGTDFNVPRSPITPEQLNALITGFKSKKQSNPKIAIIIGRESTGLSNKEISMCDFIVTIPSSKKYPTLNISHSVAVILYELSKSKESVSSHIQFAKKEEKEIVDQTMNKIFDKIEFNTPKKKQTQKVIWKRIIGKSFLTKREAFAVIGFLRKILKKI